MIKFIRDILVGVYELKNFYLGFMWCGGINWFDVFVVVIFLLLILLIERSIKFVFNDNFIVRYECSVEIMEMIVK